MIVIIIDAQCFDHRMIQWIGTRTRLNNSDFFKYLLRTEVIFHEMRLCVKCECALCAIVASEIFLKQTMISLT